jgi:O-antigen/teichoic acid export membrane protein
MLAPAHAFSMLRQGLLAMTSNGLTLVVTLVTGILIARQLGTTGRGELTAILTITTLMGWAFAAGCGQAAQYHQALNPERGGQLISTWLLLIAVLGVLAAVAGEALLPTLFAAQSPSTHQLARLYVVTAFLVPCSELLVGVLLGDHDFVFFNVFRVAQPAATAALYVALWVLHEFTLTSALAATLATGALGTLVVAVRAIRRHGLKRPSLELGRSSFWYGLRAHGTILAGLVNLRLDLLVIPAFLAASAVGLYAVATSVAWLIVAISSNLSNVVLSVAARQGAEGTRTVLFSLQATLLIGAALALVLALLANVLVPLVYGPAFSGSVLPFRLLLPGSVLYAAATMLWSGLYAANRPFRAAISQLVGLAVTLVGLLLFLRQGGIVAAAIVSTASYGVVFAASLILYQRATNVKWALLLPSWAELVGAGEVALRGAQDGAAWMRVARPWRG